MYPAPFPPLHPWGTRMKARASSAPITFDPNTVWDGDKLDWRIKSRKFDAMPACLAEKSGAKKRELKNKKYRFEQKREDRHMLSFHPSADLGLIETIDGDEITANWSNSISESLLFLFWREKLSHFVALRGQLLKNGILTGARARLWQSSGQDTFFSGRIERYQVAGELVSGTELGRLGQWY